MSACVRARACLCVCVRACVPAHSCAFGSLLTLKLARNKINDIGAWELAEALKANRTLTKLDLTRNSVEEAGATELNEALRVAGERGRGRERWGGGRGEGGREGGRERVGGRCYTSS